MSTKPKATATPAMPTVPNEAQAGDYLNRVTQNLNRAKDEQTTRQLMYKIREWGEFLYTTNPETAQFIACALFPQASTATEAIKMFTDHAKKLIGFMKECHTILPEARKKRESEFVEHDKACEQRKNELNEESKQAEFSYLGCLSAMSRDIVMWKTMGDKGLRPIDLEKLGHKQWDEDEQREAKNKWGIERQEAFDRINAEREKIRRFKYTRDTRDLPASVLKKLTTTETQTGSDA